MEEKNNLLSKKEKEIAREYIRNGYSVEIAPRKSDLPMELRKLNFIPDMIVSRDNQKTIIEVKSYNTIIGTKLDRIAAVVNKLNGWELEIIYTNPKDFSINNNEINISNERLYLNLKRAEVLIGKYQEAQINDVILLLIWGTIESILRNTLNTYNSYKLADDTKSIIRDSVIYGIIGVEDQQYLNNIFEKRNRIAHGYFTTDLTLNEVNNLLDYGYNLLDQGGI